VTLRHLMMLHRIDQGCARMNAGLAAVAIVLGFATGIVATIRLAQSSAPAFASDVSFFLAAIAQPGAVSW
jgi:hypothetical protein